MHPRIAILVDAAGRWIEPVGHDLRDAIRSLCQSPGFTIAAALTLALGIGVNTAVFGIINGFFKPLPVPDAGRIVVVAAAVAGDTTGLRYRFSFPAFAEIRDRTTTLSAVVGFDLNRGGLRVDGSASPFVYHAVTGDFFTALRLQPAKGRVFHAGEGERSGDTVTIVLGYSYWQSHFGGDPGVVNRTVQLDGRDATIVGVAPKGFQGPFNHLDADGYATLSSAGGTNSHLERFDRDRSTRFLTMLGRLNAGVAVAAAQVDLELITRQLGQTYPGTDGHTAIRVIPEPLARPMPLPFFAQFLPVIRTLMLVLASLVLLIACLNVANLWLVRAVRRQHEMAIRATLGSAPGRLMTLVLAEAVVVAVWGLLAGVPLGRWAVDLLIRSIDVESVERSTGVTYNFDAGTFDGRVYAYAATLAIASALTIALLPALRASRARVNDLLQRGRAASPAGGRLRNSLVVAQVTGSLVLLIVAALLVRNLQRAQGVDLGFDPQHVVTARVSPIHAGYSRTATTAFFDELDRRLAALPGVTASAQAFSVPLSYAVGEGSPIVEENTHVRADEPQPSIGYNTISPGYFETLRIPLVAGRAFAAQDANAAAPVAIVNQSLADRFWPGENAIGKRFVLPEDDGQSRQVVGVVRDSKYIAVFEGALPHFYIPIDTNKLPSRALLVRSAQPTDELGEQIRAVIASLDRGLPVVDVVAMDRAIAGNMGFLLFRVGAVQAGALGALGLALAVIGVYGVVSYGAEQQARAIGIRVAVGAEAHHIRRLILGHGATLVAIGVGLGLIGALAATRAMQTVLVFVDAADPLTFAAVALLLAAVTLAACYLPARRAMRSEPMTVLRQD